MKTPARGAVDISADLTIDLNALGPEEAWAAMRAVHVVREQDERLRLFASSTLRERLIASYAYAAGVDAMRKQINAVVGSGAETVRADALRDIRVKAPRFERPAPTMYEYADEAVVIIARGIRAAEHQESQPVQAPTVNL